MYNGYVSILLLVLCYSVIVSSTVEIFLKLSLLTLYKNISSLRHIIIKQYEIKEHSYYTGTVEHTPETYLVEIELIDEGFIM